MVAGEKHLAQTVPKTFLGPFGTPIYFLYLLLFSRFHGCDDCNQQPAEKRLKFDDSKHKFLSKQGHLIVKKECEWNNELKSLDFSTTAYFDILNRSADEQTIIRGISSGSLFGFVKCSVRSPEAFIEKYESLNFPPIIRNFEIDEDHLSDYMLTRVRKYNKKFPQRILGQTFHAQSIWLFTPLAKFYMSLGLEIYNVEQVLQYHGFKCLENFKNTVTSMRMSADRDRNPEKSTTAKLVGNR